MDNFKILENDDLGALASPFRRQLLDELRETPASASHIARRHDMSRQRVGYHMRELVKAGYLEVVEERQQRGLKEQLYRVRSFAYVHATVHATESIDDDRHQQDRFAWATLLNLMAKGLWDLIKIRRLADARRQRVATLAMETRLRFRNPSERKAFTEELIQAVNAVSEKYQVPDEEDGRDFRLLVGAYPHLDERRQLNG